MNISEENIIRLIESKVAEAKEQWLKSLFYGFKKHKEEINAQFSKFVRETNIRFDEQNLTINKLVDQHNQIANFVKQTEVDNQINYENISKIKEEMKNLTDKITQKNNNINSISSKIINIEKKINNLTDNFTLLENKFFELEKKNSESILRVECIEKQLKTIMDDVHREIRLQNEDFISKIQTSCDKNILARIYNIESNILNMGDILNNTIYENNESIHFTNQQITNMHLRLDFNDGLIKNMKIHNDNFKKETELLTKDKFKKFENKIINLERKIDENIKIK